MADERSPIDRAIDAAEAKQLEEELRALEPRKESRLDLLAAPHDWDGSQEVQIMAPAEDRGRRPVLLLYDEAQLAWRAIILPPGSAWRVVPDGSGPWTP